MAAARSLTQDGTRRERPTVTCELRRVQMAEPVAM